MKDFLDSSLRRISGKSDLAGAIRYTLSRWEALTLVLRDGRACIDNNAAERAMRPMTLGRNYVQQRIMRSSAWRSCAGPDLVGPLARSPSWSFA